MKFSPENDMLIHQDSCIDFVKKRYSALYNFWIEGKVSEWNSSSLQDHADFIYTFFFLRKLSSISLKSVNYFCSALSELPLAGVRSESKSLLPHLTAYLLGCLNLLEEEGFSCRERTLNSIPFELKLLIDEDTLLPLWPKIWSHHSWRVSHWIGGVPSILLTLARHQSLKLLNEDLVNNVMESIDKNLINENTGLMVAYRSKTIQSIFRVLYRLRHSPEHGDIGGLVHIHWVNHSLDRNYKSVKHLIDTCLSHLPAFGFLEDVPYCLDFDYVQILRTASLQSNLYRRQEITSICERYRTDILKFLLSISDQKYTIHKLVGALATLEESEFQINGNGLDIIKSAYWL